MSKYPLGWAVDGEGGDTTDPAEAIKGSLVPLELTFRTLIGNGTNPNVAGAVVVCIEPNWARRIADGIAATGKPVEAFSIERFGDLKTAAAARRAAQLMLQDASEITREPIDRRDVLISIKCGESDTTTELGSCPTASWMVDHHVKDGGTVIFGETTELTDSPPKATSAVASPRSRRRRSVTSRRRAPFQSSTHSLRQSGQTRRD